MLLMESHVTKQSVTICYNVTMESHVTKQSVTTVDIFLNAEKHFSGKHFLNYY